MQQQTIIDITTDATILCMKIASPALLAIMFTGFLVSMFQAVTQINEQTLSFIPKILAMTAAMFFTGPWILQTLLIFTKDIFLQITNITH